jgi:hypothetical protein
MTSFNDSPRQRSSEMRGGMKQAEIARKRRARRVKREVRRAFRRVRDQGMDSQEAARVVAEQMGVQPRTLLRELRLTYGETCQLPPPDGGQ